MDVVWPAVHVRPCGRPRLTKPRCAVQETAAALQPTGNTKRKRPSGGARDVCCTARREAVRYCSASVAREEWMGEGRTRGGRQAVGERGICHGLACPAAVRRRHCASCSTTGLRKRVGALQRTADQVSAAHSVFPACIFFRDTRSRGARALADACRARAYVHMFHGVYVQSTPTRCENTPLYPQRRHFLFVSFAVRVCSRACRVRRTRCRERSGGVERGAEWCLPRSQSKHLPSRHAFAANLKSVEETRESAGYTSGSRE